MHLGLFVWFVNCGFTSQSTAMVMSRRSVTGPWVSLGEFNVELMQKVQVNLMLNLCKNNNQNIVFPTEPLKICALGFRYFRLFWK